MYHDKFHVVFLNKHTLAGWRTSRLCALGFSRELVAPREYIDNEFLISGRAEGRSPST